MCIYIYIYVVMVVQRISVWEASPRELAAATRRSFTSGHFLAQEQSIRVNQIWLNNNSAK